MSKALLTFAPCNNTLPVVVLLVVSVLLRVMSPPYTLMGPFTFNARETVTFAVLVVLPTVNAVKSLPSTKVLPKVTGALKPAASDKKRKVPVVLTVMGLAKLMASPCTNTLLLDAVTKLKGLAPTNKPSAIQLVTFKPLACPKN